MKTNIHFICNAAVLLSVAGAQPLLAGGNTNAPPKTIEIPKSVFVIPTAAREGRDPFFPNSTRLFEVAAAVHSRSAAIASLALKGFSGEAGNRFVIINNHTFAVGDEQDVTTPAGRVHVRCLEIKDKSAIIEADGQHEELFLQPLP